MPSDLFVTHESSSQTSGTGRWFTLPVSIAAHAVLLLVAVGVPLLATNALPTPEAVLAFVAPPPAPAAPEPPPPTAAPPPVTAPEANPGAAPIVAPDRLAPERPPAPAPLVAMAMPVAPSVPAATGPLTGPPPVIPPPTVPVRVGGDIKEPRKIHEVSPTYPGVAQAARIEGTVILEATIAKDGTVRDVRVLRSIAMLDQAAVDAVRRWRYTPTTLNGEPVDVLMTVMVRFSLAR